MATARSYYPHLLPFNSSILLSKSFIGLKAFLSPAPLRRNSSLSSPHRPSSTPSPVRSSAGPFKVALLGASRGVGPPLSLLITQSPLVSQLHLYDVVNVEEVVEDVQQRSASAPVVGFKGVSQLADCLNGMDMVLIAAGARKRPEMRMEELFEINAGTVKSLVEAVAKNCPKAWIHLLTDPLNFMVPMTANVLRSYKVFDPARLFGVTKSDLVRASELLAEIKSLNPNDVEVPVVGGHDGMTILPFLSKRKPSCQLTEEEIEELTTKIRAGTQDAEALAKAAGMFLDSCLRALDGQEDVFDFALVQNAITRVDYFATRFKLCRSGVQYVVGKDFIDMSKYEEAAYNALLPVLRANIERGLEYAPRDPVVAST